MRWKVEDLSGCGWIGGGAGEGDRRGGDVRVLPRYANVKTWLEFANLE